MSRSPFESEINETNDSKFPSNAQNSMNTKNYFNFDPNAFNKNDMMNYFNDFLHNTKHPYICIAHVSFKILSVLLYFIGPYIFRSEKSKENDFIITFAITLFLVSLDFYLVKNITGRFLVKMIWWIDSNEDYSNKIVFQTSEESLLNSVNKKVFWYALYINFSIWLMQAIQMLMSFQICWFMLCFLCVFLSFCNLYNFWKCSKEQHKIVGNVLNNINLNLIYKKLFST
ncbi:golgi apparatus membrane protein TVP23, putative [Plasmodium malariae]|uniref:Golgi apparatus membrane protein TVP23 homolog n=1 Tax=Plasmodium malariae TaxID=5858 RepID=A0A1D3SPZ1_PLAMA|nr:golgi apparatus membrane protein TVP23, putative [Plasmodium malariae]SCO93983.1 golgi apparatus membrane protein TVP23, putative [Plasmodium malariae]